MRPGAIARAAAAPLTWPWWRRHLSRALSWRHHITLIPPWRLGATPPPRRNTITARDLAGFGPIARMIMETTHMMETTPYLGQTVHYVAYGSAPGADGSQTYPATCRAAIITGTSDEFPGAVSLCVLNPTGMFFNTDVPHDPGVPDGINGPGCACVAGTRDRYHAGGTWHSPAISATRLPATLYPYAGRSRSTTGGNETSRGPTVYRPRPPVAPGLRFDVDHRHGGRHHVTVYCHDTPIVTLTGENEEEATTRARDVMDGYALGAEHRGHPSAAAGTADLDGNLRPLGGDDA